MPGPRPATTRYGRPRKRPAAATSSTSCREGLDTLVGDRGVRLSGGQRQRIAIARAFLKDAPLLLLDEATSALDGESEELIREALGRLMRGRTVIAIAHRLSTVRNFDRILVLEKGRLVQDGSPDALLRGDGIYRNLIEAEMSRLANASRAPPEHACDPTSRRGTSADRLGVTRSRAMRCSGAIGLQHQQREEDDR